MLLQAVSNKLYALSFVCWLTESILIALKSIHVPGSMFNAPHSHSDFPVFLQAVSRKLYALSFVCWLTESILIALKL
jgi:hypothetical protein